MRYLFLLEGSKTVFAPPTNSAEEPIFLRSWVVLLRPPGVLCGVPAHQAVATAAVLFPSLSPRSGEGEALAPAAPWSGVAGSPGEKGPASAVMRAC